MSEEPVEPDFDDELGTLEDGPDSNLDNPAGDFEDADTPIDEAIGGHPRVVLDGKEDRKSVTAYINPMVLYQVSDLQTQLGREFTPDPRKLDVYAAIFYAGLPDTDRSMREFLREFGYREDE